MAAADVRSRSRGARSPCDLRSARETRPLRRGQLAEEITRPSDQRRATCQCYYNEPSVACTYMLLRLKTAESVAKAVRGIYLSYQAIKHQATAIFKGVIAEIKAVGSGVGWGTPAEERVGGRMTVRFRADCRRGRRRREGHLKQTQTPFDWNVLVFCQLVPPPQRSRPLVKGLFKCPRFHKYL